MVGFSAKAAPKVVSEAQSQFRPESHRLKSLARRAATSGAAVLVTVMLAGCASNSPYLSQGSPASIELGQATEHVLRGTRDPIAAAYFNAAMQKEDIRPGMLDGMASAVVAKYRSDDSIDCAQIFLGKNFRSFNAEIARLPRGMQERPCAEENAIYETNSLSLEDNSLTSGRLKGETQNEPPAEALQTMKTYNQLFNTIRYYAEKYWVEAAAAAIALMVAFIVIPGPGRRSPSGPEIAQISEPQRREESEVAQISDRVGLPRQ